MELATCQFLWYFIFLFSMFAYAALDGFDIGVGLIQPFIKSDYERRVCLNAIGPVWDSNSLWVIITIGALMAGFPDAFATLFSTLYLPVMFLIFGYIYRAVAIEFRSKRSGLTWRFAWDWIFAGASYVLAFGLGLVLANLIDGLPLEADGTVHKGILYLFSPYAIVMGIFTTSLFMIHGGLYLYMKTEKELQKHIQVLLNRIYIFFVIMWLSINVLTLAQKGYVIEFVLEHPSFILLQLVGVCSLVAMPFLFRRGHEGLAFLSSCGVIFSLIISYAVGTYPNIVRSQINPLTHSLTVYNSSSSHLTLYILLGIALAGVPLFLVYLVYAYKVFKGKVEVNQMSY